MTSILVIEDDSAYRNSIELILQMEGYDVRTAENGASGVAMTREKRPDLILCDIMMPGMDGHSVLEILKRDGALEAMCVAVCTKERTTICPSRLLLRNYYQPSSDACSASRCFPGMMRQRMYRKKLSFLLS
jgi:CheY-like chemotaxis protein